MVEVPIYYPPVMLPGSEGWEWNGHGSRCAGEAPVEVRLFRKQELVGSTPITGSTRTRGETENTLA